MKIPSRRKLPFAGLGCRARAAALSLAGAALLGGCGGGNPAAPVVVVPPLSAVVLDRQVDTLQVGETERFVATAYDSAGQPVPGVPFHWSTADPAVVTVSGSGLVRGVGEGAAFVIAEQQGLRDSALVIVYPDSGWIQQSSNANGADLHAVFFLGDGRNGWVVGNAGKVLRTTDAGGVWAPQTSNTSFNLRGVWFTGPQEGWAVGFSGTVMRTTNGGTSWQRLTNVGVGDNLLDVFFASRDTGWAVGSNGAVVRTFDRGASWQVARVPAGGTLQSVAFARARDGWAVGDNGVIAGSHDAGRTWFRVVPGITADDLRAVWRVGADSAFAAGTQGRVPRAVPGPDSVAWELRNAGANNQLEGVHFPIARIGYVVGFNAGVGGAVLRSDDGGVTWQAQTSRTPAHLFDVYFVDPLRGWAVGSGGVIVHTARGGGI
jgi:photosystem II stability/assembly factor-like uncharacterized protein